jgi:hypothetical protein
VGLAEFAPPTVKREAFQQPDCKSGVAKLAGSDEWSVTTASHQLRSESGGEPRGSLLAFGMHAEFDSGLSGSADDAGVALAAAAFQPGLGGKPRRHNHGENQKQNQATDNPHQWVLKIHAA